MPDYRYKGGGALGLAAAAALFFGPLAMGAFAQDTEAREAPPRAGEKLATPEGFSLLESELQKRQCIAVSVTVAGANAICLGDEGIIVLGKPDGVENPQPETQSADAPASAGVLTQVTIIGDGEPSAGAARSGRRDVIIIDRGARIGGEVLRIIRESSDGN